MAPAAAIAYLHSMISAVIFDCDGVLVDSEVIAHEVELAVLSQIGLDYDPHDFAIRFMGMSNDAFFAGLDADGRARLGRSIIDEIKEPIRERYYRAVEERLVEVPGARDAVRVLRLPKAVASSSEERALGIKLRKVGHWDHFAPHVYSAQHVKHAKPAPDLFLLAAKALGIPPAECLVIEDTVNGVTAGCAAGMQVWGFRGGGHMTDRLAERLTEAGAQRIVADWAEAERLFAQL
ncbi:MAG TPA: HAD-IA family hydrolase [Rhizomicrobium sp.]|nr:HAD-IA family hydrolase [Rhizomicrobium sp.]